MGKPGHFSGYPPLHSNNNSKTRKQQLSKYIDGDTSDDEWDSQLEMDVIAKRQQKGLINGINNDNIEDLLEKYQVGDNPEVMDGVVNLVSYLSFGLQSQYGLAAGFVKWQGT